MRQLLTGEYAQKPIEVSIEGKSYIFEPSESTQKNALIVFNNDVFRKSMKIPGTNGFIKELCKKMKTSTLSILCLDQALIAFAQIEELVGNSKISMCD